MTRKVKLLCLTLVAAFSINAATVGIASADVFTAEGIPILTGDQDGVMDELFADAGQVKCTSVVYAGSVGATMATQVDVSPSFSGCTFLGMNTKIEMNGCVYRLTLEGGASTSGKLDIVCPAGKEAKATAPSVGTPKCIVHVPAQNGLGTITSKNIGTGSTREVTLEVNLTGIKYSQTAGSAESGNCATADNTTNGSLTGKGRFTGETAGGTHLGIFLS